MEIEEVTLSRIHSSHDIEEKFDSSLQSILLSIRDYSGNLISLWRLSVWCSYSTSLNKRLYSKDFKISKIVSESSDVASNFLILDLTPSFPLSAPESSFPFSPSQIIDSCSSLNAHVFLSTEGSVWIESAERGRREILWEESSFTAVTCHSNSISLWTTDEKMFIWTEEVASSSQESGSGMSLVTEVIILPSSTKVLSPLPNISSLVLSLTPSGDLVCLSDLHLCDSIFLSHLPMPQRRTTTAAASATLPLPVILTLALAVTFLVFSLLYLFYRCWLASFYLHRNHRSLPLETPPPGDASDLERGTRAAAEAEGMLYDTYPDPDFEQEKSNMNEDQPQQLEQTFSSASEPISQDSSGSRRPVSYRHTAVNPLAIASSAATIETRRASCSVSSQRSHGFGYSDAFPREEQDSTGAPIPLPSSPPVPARVSALVPPIVPQSSLSLSSAGGFSYSDLNPEEPNRETEETRQQQREKQSVSVSSLSNESQSQSQSVFEYPEIYRQSVVPISEAETNLSTGAEAEDRKWQRQGERERGATAETVFSALSASSGALAMDRIYDPHPPPDPLSRTGVEDRDRDKNGESDRGGGMALEIYVMLPENELDQEEGEGEEEGDRFQSEITMGSLGEL
jgi:hypothetical protein